MIKKVNLIDQNIDLRKLGNDMMISDVVFLVDAIQEKNSNKYLATFVVNDKAEIFHEHFPGSPILPGAITLSLIINVNKMLLPKNNLFDYTLIRIEKFSFVKRINPLQDKYIVLDITYKHDGSELSSGTKVVSGTGNIYARGRLIYKR